MNLPDQLSRLAGERRWCWWRYEPVKGRRTKVPHGAKGGPAKSNDPSTWLTFAELPDDRDAVALYIGDWDPSGLYMSEVDLPARLTRYGSRWSFRRIALVRNDLDRLPHFATDTKRDDARTPWYLKNTTADPAMSWELDAMDPNDLRERVRDEIQSYMDMDTWRRALEVESVEKKYMQDFHAEWLRRLGR